MNKLISLNLLMAVPILGAVAIWNPPLAMADMVSYTTSLQSSNMCTICGPFGTVTVSPVSGFSNKISVGLSLTPGEVFANTGAGAALLFNIANDPMLAVSNLTSGFSFVQQPTHADGSGDWNTYIACDVCGTGTSPPQNSGPISFTLAVAGGTLSPSSFVTNNNNYLFASDIGVPNGSGGYYTGDVVTSSSLTPVPLPAAAWLMLSGLGGLGWLSRKQKSS